jgi:stage II sporulation protein AA (anti-sigma F factor antagonist)
VREEFGIEELGPRSFRVTGSLDVPTAGSLHEVLDLLAREPGDITLDLAGVTFMDSGGLRAVLQACSDLGDRGTVRLVGPSEQVRRLLDITGVGRSCPNLEIVGT